MNNEVIIDVRPKEVSIAVLEDKKLVELQREKQNISYAVGDIYLGKVKKVVPGLNAAFVDIGHEKEAFLHSRDLGSAFLTSKSFLAAHAKYGKNFDPTRVKTEKELDKDGPITERLSVGDQVMVQITKEPISTKGPRLTGELSFAGRYLVLIPFSDKVSISQKIRNAEERNRLRQLILSIKPKNVTVIVRTSAQGVRVAELDHEIRSLTKKWNNTIANLNKKKKGNLLFEESSRALSLLRDTYNPNFKDIYINDKAMVQEIADYVEYIDPGKGSIVHFYNDTKPIFDHFDITKQIKQLFGRTVAHKNGAYLVIEQTEAMHVIDVNSGNRAKGSSQQEETAIEVNLVAAQEVARQLRLRDLGGIIVVDFIDMGLAANRQKLFEQMSEYMKADRAKHTILPLSKFGLMQITRQRVRQAMKIDTQEKCPTCHGKGQIQPSIFFTDELEEKVRILTQEHGIKKLNLHIHPYVAAFVTKKKSLLSLGSSIHSRWKNSYSKGINIIPDQSIGIVDYEFVDADGNELSHVLESSQEKEEPKKKSNKS